MVIVENEKENGCGVFVVLFSIVLFCVLVLAVPFTWIKVLFLLCIVVMLVYYVVCRRTSTHDLPDKCVDKSKMIYTVEPLSGGKNKMIVDYYTIHDCRRQIAYEIDEILLNLKKTEKTVESIGESWNDDIFKEFQDNFSQDKEIIKHLCEVLDYYQSNLLYELEKRIKIYESHCYRP